MVRSIRIVALIVAVITLLLGGAALYAQAQGPGGPRGRGGFGPGGPGMGVPLRQLNLSDAQQDQVRQLMTQYREQVKVLNDRLESDIRAILTPEQQQQADTLKAGRDAQMKQRREQRSQQRSQ